MPMRPALAAFLGADFCGPAGGIDRSLGADFRLASRRPSAPHELTKCALPFTLDVTR